MERWGGEDDEDGDGGAAAPAAAAVFPAVADATVAAAPESLIPVADAPVAATAEADIPLADAPVAAAAEADIPLADAPVAAAAETHIPLADAPVAPTAEAHIPEADAPVAPAAEAHIPEAGATIALVADALIPASADVALTPAATLPDPGSPVDVAPDGALPGSIYEEAVELTGPDSMPLVPATLEPTASADLCEPPALPETLALTAPIDMPPAARVETSVPDVSDLNDLQILKFLESSMQDPPADDQDVEARSPRPAVSVTLDGHRAATESAVALDASGPLSAPCEPVKIAVVEQPTPPSMTSARDLPGEEKASLRAAKLKRLADLKRPGYMCVCVCSFSC